MHFFVFYKKKFNYIWSVYTKWTYYFVWWETRCSCESMTMLSEHYSFANHSSDGLKHLLAKVVATWTVISKTKSKPTNSWLLFGNSDRVICCDVEGFERSIYNIGRFDNWTFWRLVVIFLSDVYHTITLLILSE